MGTCQPSPPTRRAVGSAGAPARPLRGGVLHVADLGWRWVRIYHHDTRNVDATVLRYRRVDGRFDPHDPPATRGVLYAGDDVDTAICEALTAGAGPSGRITVCENRRVAILQPAIEPVAVQDFVAGSPTDLAAPDDLGDGPYDRADTQAWARAIHEDRPAGPQTAGVRYWSARHRTDDGSRVAANTAIWDTAAPLRVRTPGRGIGGRAEHQVTAGPMWLRVQAQLRAAGLRAVAIPAVECGQCRTYGFP